MERSFKKEVEALRLGEGETFRGEGILAITKALLQSGVSYVSGYQGAPVSHLLDVLIDAEDMMAELGVHLETCTNEASAAAMLGASINYPLRGAVTWKSIVGTNVAADALSNLSSPGVLGGAMIILGEDYGEGASVIQERSYAYALKSSMWLLDPRPDLPTIVRTVEKGFELSEASHAPVMLELRIRACHATGEFIARDNRKGIASGLDKLPGPPKFDYRRLAHPPVIYSQERLKIEERLPAARAFIREHKLNEFVDGDLADIGIVVMGGLTNSVLRALERMGLADVFGTSRVPMLVLNVVYPLVPEEITGFCAGKHAVLVVEEGFPDYIEQAVNVELRRADLQTRIYGKGPLPKAGEYASDVLLEGVAAFLQAARPAGVDVDTLAEAARGMVAHKAKAAAALGALPPRPPTFCTGCPERPVFSAIKLMERELGPTHISADIGCHAFATFAPFSMGNSILGYGMSLASAAAVGPNMDRRSIAIMGDGGFWHNGLITGVASSLFNKGDGVLIVMQNGYTSATGQQYMPSSKTSRSGEAPGMDIEQAVNVELRRADIQTKVYGKGPLPKAGEYASDVLLEGIAGFLQVARPAGLDADTIAEKARGLTAHKGKAAAALGHLPPRPPSFCTGCPERPVFSALKLMQRELGPAHIAADIGCHAFATFAPFSMGNSILGYGMSLASAAAVGPNMQKRPIAVMGDGGFWHNGLITGVASNLFNKGDGVLVIMQNGYTSATGQQYMPSSKASRSGEAPGMDIEQTLRSMGVKWMRTVRTYGVSKMVATLKDAMKTAERGLKVIIADGECMLARQRRIRAEDSEKLKRGERVTKARYGVDDEICTGDHSCIRLSGCPSLSVKPSPDPLRTDPVATVVESCVGCGLCGEVAHAAVLCPSFYRAEIVRNATWRDRTLFAIRQRVIGWLGGYNATKAAA